MITTNGVVRAPDKHRIEDRRNGDQATSIKTAGFEANKATLKLTVRTHRTQDEQRYEQKCKKLNWEGQEQGRARHSFTFS